MILRDGTEVPVEDSVFPIRERERSVMGAVIVFRNAGAACAMKVTGPPHRILLNDRINQAIAHAKRHNHQVAVLFLDLDGFKHIDDSLGHPMGDKLLEAIATRLVTNVRAPDTVSRQRGDEFVVLLPEISIVIEAPTAAQRMLEAVAEAHLVDQHDLRVTTSIGISIYPDDGIDVETLIKNADTAMYQAREKWPAELQVFRRFGRGRAPLPGAEAFQRYLCFSRTLVALPEQYAGSAAGRGNSSTSLASPPDVL